MDNIFDRFRWFAKQIYGFQIVVDASGIAVAEILDSIEENIVPCDLEE